jgi:hypothetical protein
MKFKIKSLDSRQDLIQQVREFLYFFYSEKEGFSDFQIIPDGVRSITFSMTFNWKDIIALSLIWPTEENMPITILKVKSGVYVLFEKEELKFFDLLDFEIDPRHYTVVKQDIIDWVDM